MCKYHKKQSKMSSSSCDSKNVIEWSTEAVADWLKEKGHSKYVDLLCNQHSIDGKALLLLNEHDLRTSPLSIQILGDVKRLGLDIRQLKMENRQTLVELGYDPTTLLYIPNALVNSAGLPTKAELDYYYSMRQHSLEAYTTEDSYLLPHSSPSSEDGTVTALRPEIWKLEEKFYRHYRSNHIKALIALAYLFVVTWITAFVMVIVHDRVPDMKKYPPLPDIFLDNVPHIPWAFHMCEWTGTLLLLIWLAVLAFHKYRFILLRRFFALSGTVFLLRCITMLITSLSVPGTHLDCTPRNSTSNEPLLLDLLDKMKQAYIIWKGAGMSIQGVRTCGDYMFSGHTVALTMLNFFITEYTPRDIYILHLFTWMLNCFGIFFILSGHEHYSIDVFIAFYITSRLFLYYHTLANNQSLMQRDTGRTRIWFPLFSFFESDVDGIVPNEYESPLVVIKQLFRLAKQMYKKSVLLFHAHFSNVLTETRINLDQSAAASIRKNKRKTQ
ncbi:sphingomyelin synthase-related protein 1-like isoform X2 [Macrosteles quadrilineatus]|uniref:sphingomyelin synthase-related protein 1-like isoform X2 n=1 Tax=Macrosteles quadrilineatus TaxID=74068 RepID=UPI0023E0B344|nr:sphingomyelin synthase-related protein 1-like isoform X2 [Macrosteles quadrilineatus]